MPKPNSSIILKDILWYFLGSIIPLLIGLIKSPIFTRVFSTEDFGAYNLVILAFGYISTISYSWIISCVWRYFHRYKNENKTGLLFSNVLFLYLIFSVVILALALIWFSFEGNILIKRLILLCFFQYFTSEVLTLFFIKPRLEGKVFSYNLFQAIRTAGSFGLLLLLTFILNLGIEAFIISTIVFNVVFILVAVVPICINLKLSFKLVEKSHLKTFFNYGKIGLVISICSTLLISSDRFIIEFFNGLSEVGIYSQNYNIAQISIAILIQVFWSTLNPHMLPILESKPKNMEQHLFGYFKLFFFCFAPITLYFVLYAKEIAYILLGEEFRFGYSVIFWVAIAEFLAGLCFLSIAKLRFNNQFRTLSITYTLAIILNIGLNIILIPAFDYTVAAITTVVANFFLFAVFLSRDSIQYFTLLQKQKDFRFCIIVLAIQALIHFLTAHSNFPLAFYIIEGIIFVGIYIFIALKFKWINLKNLALSNQNE